MGGGREICQRRRERFTKVRSSTDPAGERRLNHDERMIQLTTEPIDAARLLDEATFARRRAPSCLFLGTTRELTDGRRTVALDYEAYARWPSENWQSSKPKPAAAGRS